MKSVLFLASIALVLQLCPSFVVQSGPSRVVGESSVHLITWKPIPQTKRSPPPHRDRRTGYRRRDITRSMLRANFIVHTGMVSLTGDFKEITPTALSC